MNNNDILRRLRFTFDFSDTKMVAIFAQADKTVTRADISGWLKKDNDEAFVVINDEDMATFLNGFINDKRGKKEGVKPKAEVQLTNNIIFIKLKIALNLQANDILEIMDLADLKISKHELSAFFRKVGHKHFRVCKDQILRNFLKGLQLKHKP